MQEEFNSLAEEEEVIEPSRRANKFKGNREGQQEADSEKDYGNLSNEMV